MKRSIALAVLAGAVLTQPLTAAAQSQRPLGNSASLPALPPGKSTIFGGQIRNVDPVRDQLSLSVYGERPMKILFDERTQVYRDGARIRVRDLRPEEHASVETTLDGSKVFAVSIHILSRPADGDYSGRVVNYDSGSGELMMDGMMSGRPFKVHVAGGASVTREGQSGFTSAGSGLADLVPGALVTVKFAPDGQGHGVASQISVFAVPGASFIFSGAVTFVDLHTGTLVVTDPHDSKSYHISFDAARQPASRTLSEGKQVRVAADYDGTRYVAGEITVY